MEICTKSAEETQKLGEKIGNSLIQKGRGESATILTLSGELGSGKTTFVQGLVRAFGIKNRILSPTFILSREYPIQNSVFTKLVHIDLYRGEKSADFISLGLEEIFKNPANMVIIEWPERLGKQLPMETMRIDFKQISDLERFIYVRDIK